MTPRPRSTRRRATLAAATAAITCVGSASLVLPAQGSPTAQRHTQRLSGQSADAPKGVRSGDKIGAHDRQLLARAESRGVKKVRIIISATEARSARSAAKAVRRVGGTVEKRLDATGYVRALVPVGAVLRLAASASVSAIDLKETIPLDDPAPTASAVGKRPIPAPSGSTPDANPYMPTNETGSVAFKKAHRYWDGRGTTIGILDSGVAIDHPALARTTVGQRKIVDWVTATDPLTDGDLTWRAMLTTVSGPTFTYRNRTYTAPAGDFLVSRFSESVTAGGDGPDGDVNRDGDTTDSWAVLYDPATHDIWVDTDDDASFTDEGAAQRPYRESQRYRYLGKDDPTTDVAERMPFVVEYRQDVSLDPLGGAYVGQTADFVNIGIVDGEHGTHVAGITAANGLFGGAMDGQAPGAKLVSSRACVFSGGCTSVALTEGMQDLVINRGVDVVNMSIGGLPALNDGNNARALQYKRLIDRYGVQLVISAGNSGPGINTTGDPGLANGVISVAAAISRDTWWYNYGSEVTTPLALFNFSSRGPREDGGLKPSLSAPGSAVSTIPLFLPGSSPTETGYSLPAGYAMLNGTSMASPQTAGGVALLLSAARATDRAVTPGQLRTALMSTADPIPGQSAAGQGTGMLDVPGAWAMLATDRTVRDGTISASAPVCSALSSFLAQPGRGVGIYNRCTPGAGGVAVGTAKAYAVTLTRTGGPAGARPYAISWQGNDGTWSSPTSVTLPRGAATKITVKATVRTSGAHSAIMRLDDRTTTGTDAFVLNTVVSPLALPTSSYRRTIDTSVTRNSTRSFFLTVPKGVKAMQVVLDGIATGSQVRFVGFHPYGYPIEDTSSLACYTNRPGYETCNPFSRAYLDPTPGVWELEVEARRTSPALVNPLSLHVSYQGLTVTPARAELASATVGTPAPVTWTVKNDFGAATVRPTGGPLSSAKVARPTIADGAVQTYDVVVPAGAGSLTATIGGTSDRGSDLDLYVYDEDGNLVGQSADGDSEESVTIPSPAAGTYTVEVDGYDVPSGSTAYDYSDSFSSASLGVLQVQSGSITLAKGESATVRGAVLAQSAPAAGRDLLGTMRLVNEEGTTIGSGQVLVRSVVPAP